MILSEECRLQEEDSEVIDIRDGFSDSPEAQSF
jgi:hypothetical protein